jgi:hypothetical protein
MILAARGGDPGRTPVSTATAGDGNTLRKHKGDAF